MDEDSRSADGGPHPRADIEVDAGWSANAVRRRRGADVSASTHGDIEEWEELTEAKLEAAEGTRWRLRAWLRSSNR